MKLREKNKYSNYKNNTCGYSGCREYKKFIDYVSERKLYFDKLDDKHPDIIRIKETNEYKKYYIDLETYLNEVLNKQKEYKCITLF